MIIRARQLVTDLLFIVLVLNFSPLNDIVGGRLYIPLIICLLLAVVFERTQENIISFIKEILLYIILSVGTLFIGKKLFPGYSQIYTIETIVVIYCMLFLAICKYQYITSVDWLYIIGLVVIIASLFVSYVKEKPVMILYEQNISGILIFLFFMYCYKKRHLLGVIVGLVFGLFFSDSRSYSLLVLLFFLTIILKIKAQPLMRRVSKVNIFNAIVLLSILSVLLSIYWVNVVAKNGYSGYHLSFNDNSNYVRATSILYGAKIFNHNFPKIIFGGFGLRLKEYMGINTKIGFFTRFMGDRLVQAHSSVINMCLCMGVIQTTLYFLLLSKVLHKYDIYENLEYIYPFLLNAMFMHSLLNLRWAILWIIIIALPKRDIRLRKICFVRSQA
ncbi:hypothetical protein [Butyrivibrio sp. LC3010]|uniref:hypothetical protein n=1 Tax=Butyrivibrio sp. LC3010 TaxID=1280680 RepID=UPI0004173355|nr:hypothetical protein [Butyrivibrio sp. LC3010]